MAEVLLLTAMRERGATAQIESAGTMTTGRPADPLAVDAVKAYGADLTGHRSRPIERSFIEEADLVIGMAREHVREAVALVPTAWERSFSLKELVRRASASGPRPQGTDVREWASRLNLGRRPSDLMGRSIADDIADPLGLGAPAFAATAIELQGLIQSLVVLTGLFSPDP